MEKSPFIGIFIAYSIFFNDFQKFHLVILLVKCNTRFAKQGGNTRRILNKKIKELVEFNSVCSKSNNALYGKSNAQLAQFPF